MYYTKIAIGEDAIITIELCDGEYGNIFTTCPKCGKEMAVDLREVYDDDGDLSSTAIYCEKCSKEAFNVQK